MTLTDIPTAYAVDSDEIIMDENFDENIEAQEITTEMKKCYSLSITLKWLTWLDFIFSMLYSFGNLYFSIPLIMSAFGYLGAIKFHKTYTLIYLSYIVIINILRFNLFLIFYLELPESEKPQYGVDLFIVSICTCIECWIGRLIYRFYTSMKTLSAEEIIFLRMIAGIQDVHVILW